MQLNAINNSQEYELKISTLKSLSAAGPHKSKTIIHKPISRLGINSFSFLFLREESPASSSDTYCGCSGFFSPEDLAKYFVVQ